MLKLNQIQRARVEYEEYLRLAPKGDYATEARDLIKKLPDGYDRHRTTSLRYLLTHLDSASKNDDHSR